MEPRNSSAAGFPAWRFPPANAGTARNASMEANPNARRRRENVDPIFIFIELPVIGRYDTCRVSDIVNASPKGQGSIGPITSF
jgi:hypothetical protein